MFVHRHPVLVSLATRRCSAVVQLQSIFQASDARTDSNLRSHPYRQGVTVYRWHPIRYITASGTEIQEIIGRASVARRTVSGLHLNARWATSLVSTRLPSYEPAISGICPKFPFAEKGVLRGLIRRVFLPSTAGTSASPISPSINPARVNQLKFSFRYRFGIFKRGKWFASRWTRNRINANWARMILALRQMFSSHQVQGISMAF